MVKEAVEEAKAKAAKEQAEAFYLPILLVLYYKSHPTHIVKSSASS